MTEAPATLDDYRSLLKALPGPDAGALLAAEGRNAQLTKPPAALGRLETLARWYAGWRGNGRPVLERPQVVIFAGNHGVAARGLHIDASLQHGSDIPIPRILGAYRSASHAPHGRGPH